MIPLGIFMKAEADRLDFDIDFSRWLPDGDTLIHADAHVVPSESMVSSPQIVVQPETVKVWLTDGVSGKSATILVTVTTAQNRVKQVEFEIRVRG